MAPHFIDIIEPANAVEDNLLRELRARGDVLKASGSLRAFQDPIVLLANMGRFWSPSPPRSDGADSLNPKRSHRSAYMAILDMLASWTPDQRAERDAADGALDDLHYCEGLVRLPGEGIHFAWHAWCVTPDGVVVDRTLKAPAYYGIVFRRPWLLAALADQKGYGVLTRPALVERIFEASRLDGHNRLHAADVIAWNVRNRLRV